MVIGVDLADLLQVLLHLQELLVMCFTPSEFGAFLVEFPDVLHGKRQLTKPRI